MADGERYKRSISQWNDYSYCSWQFRLKRILKIEERPAVWSAGGNAFHRCSEAFDRQFTTKNLQFPPSAGVYHNWRESWSNMFAEELDELRQIAPESEWRTAGRPTNEKPNGEDVNWWAENGPNMMSAYIKWRHDNIDRLQIATMPDGSPAIEIPVETVLGEDHVPVVGYVDRLFEDVRQENATARYLLVDLKSGSSTPAVPVQLGQYSVQLEEQLLWPIRWGAFYDARKGALGRPINLTAWGVENLGVAYDMLDRAVEQGIFVPNLGRHCFSCGVRSSCIFQGGSEPEGTDG